LLKSFSHSEPLLSPNATDESPVFSQRVIEWQKTHGRHGLPWQNTRDPYRVWLSEVMLQQTQVSTVLPYYERFLQRFPTVNDLAEAHLDDVLTLWSGLGYYSRARHLHRCAQEVMSTHQGQFPGTAEQLVQLPGIGRSTAAAIAAFCFGERVAILDGNVKRVLSRAMGFYDDLALQANERRLWQQATDLLPASGNPQAISAYTQGLMDLGATLCTPKKPACLMCPVQAICIVSQTGQPESLPIKSRKLKRSFKQHWWLCLQAGSQIWLVQRPTPGVWAGLWSLPEFESLTALEQALHDMPVKTVDIIQDDPIKHALTHFDWQLHPVRVEVDKAAPQLLEAWLGVQPIGPGQWRDISVALQSGLPAPLKKWLVSLAQKK
jgi:A/G-specific adenine glycosylase